MRNHLIVFVKTPRMGRVKRRLAADIGTPAATFFYRATLAQLLRRLAGDRRWRTWIAITPDRDCADRALWPPRWRRLKQGDGDLGARMRRPLRALPPGPVVIVGSDVPDIGRHHIARAFRALGRAPAVFGPSRDGGYWLVGVRRRPRIPDLFRGVRWSSPHALADTLRNLAGAAFLETLEDIDDGAALARWRRAARSGAGVQDSPITRKSAM